MKYHSRIQDLRIDADKTQQEIADILFCQREVYRRYEKGEREIPISGQRNCGMKTLRICRG